MNVVERLRADLTAARLERHTTEISMIRTLIAAVENAEAIESDGSKEHKVGLGHDLPRRTLTDDDIVGILERERGELVDAIAHYRVLGLSAHLQELEERLRIVDRYAPPEHHAPDIS